MAKKQKCPEFENHERWLVSFADMMTLLFALFVVLFSLKSGSDTPEIEQAAGAVQESFNDVLEDIPVDRRVAPKAVGIGIFDNMRGDSPLPRIMPKFPSSEERLKIIDDEMTVITKKLRLYGPGKTPEPKDPGQARVISVMRDDDGIRLRMAGVHFYDSGAYKVRKTAESELAQVGNVLKTLGRRITIEGHTDSLSPSNSMGNWELSGLRAGYIARYFINQQGFAPSQLMVAGYADTKPMANNTTDEGRRLNRRIEIKIHYDD